MKISFYQDHRGHFPVAEFLDKNLEIKVKAIILLKIISEFGLAAALSHIKKLSGYPIWEIKIVGRQSSRILYAHKTKEEVVLLHAFKKKTNKTPIQEIKIALNRLKNIS